MNHRLYRDLRRIRRNATRLADAEQSLLLGYFQRSDFPGGALTPEQAAEAVAALVALGEKMAAEGRSLTAKVIVGRAGQVAAIFRQQAAPTTAAPAPAPVPTPAPVVAAPAPVVAAPAPMPLTGSDGTVLSVKDNDFIERYYDHFAETQDTGYSPFPKRRPETPDEKLAVLPILRGVSTDLDAFTYWPHVVSNPPRYLGQASAREPKPPEGAVTQSFRYSRPQASLIVQFGAGWTSGAVQDPEDHEAYRYSSYSGSVSGYFYTLANGGEGQGIGYKYGNSNKNSACYPQMFGLRLGAATQGVRSLAKTDDRWLIPFSSLTPEGKERARAFHRLRVEDQSGSGYKTPSGDVCLAAPSFTLKPDEVNNTATIQKIAARLERAGLFAPAAALRIAFGGQAMEADRNEDLPYLAKSPRIESGVVTSREGTRIEVEGLALRDASYRVSTPAGPALVQSALALQPPASFSVTKTVASRTIGGAPTIETYTPFDYQKVGIAYLAMNDGKGLIGDEMGLGKTVQALGFVSLRTNPVDGRPTLPALVVCPASVVTNWKRECNTWLPDLKVWIYESGAKHRPKHDVCIVSWDLMGIYPERFTNQGYQTLIADEAHYVKNLYRGSTSKPRYAISIDALMGREGDQKADTTQSPYTRRTSSFLIVSDTIPNRILLTGTPLSNGRIREAWTLLRALDPLAFPELSGFMREYSPGQAEIDRSVADGINPFHKIERLFDYYQCRRIKQVVADQTNIGRLAIPGQPAGTFGPVKRRKIDYIDVTRDQIDYLRIFDDGLTEIIRSAQYAQRMTSAIKAILNGEDLYEVIARVNEMELDPESTKAVALATMTYERQYIGEMKIPNAICWIDEKVVRQKKPVVVWAYHKNVVQALSDVLEERKVKFRVVDGSKTAEQKGAAVDAFQSGEIDVIIGTTAMAEGVTLVRAHEALFVEPWWVPGKVTQAEDRIFRVGQKEDVLITTLRLPNVQTPDFVYESIDERMYAGVAVKEERIEMIVGLDLYETTEGEVTLCAQAKEAMKFILRRIGEVVATATLLPDEVTEADVREALEGGGKNQITVYNLSARYTDGSALDPDVKMLVDEAAAYDLLDSAKERIGKAVSLTASRTGIIEFLANEPEQTAPLSRVVQAAQMESKASGQKIPGEPRILKDLDLLAKAGVLMPVEDDPNVSQAAKKSRSIIEAFQKAGGVLDADEVKKKIPNVTRTDLNDLIVKGVLEVSIQPRIRLNPRRRPGQMARNGRLPDLPLNPYVAIDTEGWEPGSYEAQRCEAMRQHTLGRAKQILAQSARRNPRRPAGPSAAYSAYALRVNLRGHRNPDYDNDCIDAYNRLRDAVERETKAGMRVNPKHVKLLRDAYDHLRKRG